MSDYFSLDYRTSPENDSEHNVDDNNDEDCITTCDSFEIRCTSPVNNHNASGWPEGQLYQQPEGCGFKSQD